MSLPGFGEDLYQCLDMPVGYLLRNHDITFHNHKHEAETCLGMSFSTSCTAHPRLSSVLWGSYTVLMRVTISK